MDSAVFRVDVTNVGVQQSGGGGGRMLDDRGIQSRIMVPRCHFTIFV